LGFLYRFSPAEAVKKKNHPTAKLRGSVANNPVVFSLPPAASDSALGPDSKVISDRKWGLTMLYPSYTGLR
jgi:hypothetical protein